MLREKRAIDLYLRNHSRKPGKANELLKNKPEYQKLILPYFKPKSQELLDWMNAPYEKNTIYPEHLNQKTNAGFYVRSKSEVMIVQFLQDNQIPFRYECLLWLGEAILYPDFTIRHPVTGETYYWEHFGRMDEKKYLDKMISKMELYTSHGIIPTIQLITTYETKEHPLSVITIQKTIEEYFL